MKQKTHIRQLFYGLASRFGESVTVTIPASRSVDYTIGVVTKADRVYNILRAAVLPADMIRDFVYDLSFIAANKNFTYGGTFNRGERLFLLDTTEENLIPVNEITIVTIDGTGYTVAEWTSYTSQHYALLLKVVEGRI